MEFLELPSYLVRIEHILCVFGKNNILMKKYFFDQKISDFDQNFQHFEYFHLLLKILENVENFDQNLRFLIEKIFFHQKFLVFQKHIKYAPSSPNMKV